MLASATAAAASRAVLMWRERMALTNSAWASWSTSASVKVAARFAIDRHTDSMFFADTYVSAKNIESVCRSMAKRAATFTEADVDQLAQAEFVKAIRSLHINTARDAAAAVAEASITGATHE